MDFFATIRRLKINELLKKNHILDLILGTIDIFTIALAFQCTYILNYPIDKGAYFISDPDLLNLFGILLPFWLIFLYLLKVTEIPRTKRYWVLLYEYFQSAVLIIVLLLIFHSIVNPPEIPDKFLIELPFIGFLLLFIARTSEYSVFKRYRSQGYNHVNLALIADDSSIPFIASLIVHKEWGYRIIAIYTGSEAVRKGVDKGTIVLPEESIGTINELMEQNAIDEVLYLKNNVASAEVRDILKSCEELGVIFRLMYRDNKPLLTNAVATSIGEEKFLNFINVPHNTFGLALKKIMDISISLFMIILFSPALLLIALGIKMSSRGPVIFRQPRVGLRGRQFMLYKFRTMVVDADKLRKDLEAKNEMDGPVFKIANDPRVTRIGGFLRKTGLDELPQLFNVLKGEMSLIGPRPPLEAETKMYKRWQLRRLSVKPGLSCFWQIEPNRNSIKFERWMEMDLAYIDNWSPRLDIMILFKTLRTVVKRSGL